jgi:protein-S-isoprenylcysteine O-methyltransferase Ste14
MFLTFHSVRLPKLALVPRELAQHAPMAARLAGLQLNAEQPARVLGSAAVLAVGLLWVIVPEPMSSAAAVLCFLAAIALRFGFLFASFTRRGIASRLVARLGLENGHAVYGMALDLLLFAQRVSFIALACATARDPSGVFGHTLRVLGLLMVPVGVGATIWAARSVGHDAYHYRDLFTGSRSVSLEESGPYALCDNPMYALGPLAGYGIAMLALSPIALLAAGVNQGLLFAFNKLVEQPRLRRANGIFVETQRRYALARSLLGFDPRQELTRLRHSETQ